MTDLTARELMDTILRSLVQTRAAFKKAPRPREAMKRSLRDGS